MVGEAEDIRDPFNNYVFIFEGVDFPTLRALGELLYTGKAYLDSDLSKKMLLSFLNEDLLPGMVTFKFQSESPTFNECQIKRQIFV